MAVFFAHRGVLGVNGWNPEAPSEFEEMKVEYLTPALINNPLEPGQLGFVCDLEKCSFTKEAIEFLKKDVKLSNDSIGEIDIFKSADKNIIAWLGGPIRAFPKGAEGSRDYDPSILDSIIPIEMDLDPNFVEFVDKALDTPQHDPDEDQTEDQIEDQTKNQTESN